MRNTRKSAKAQTRKRRASLCADGLRPVLLWLPDARSAAFREKCERESRSLSGDLREADALARIAKAADTRGGK